MPAPQQPERGIRKGYQARYRVNVGPCTGVDKSGDPSVLADTALAEGINISLRDGTMSERGGQEKANSSSAMTGCVYGMVEMGSAGEAGFADLLLTVPGGGIDVSLGTIDSWIPGLPDDVEYSRLTEGSGIGEGEIGVYGVPIGESTQLTADSTVSRYSFTRWNGDVVLAAAALSDATFATFGIFKLLQDQPEIAEGKMKVEEIFHFASGITPASLATIPAPAPDGSPAREYLFVGTLGGGVIGTDGTHTFTSLAEATLDDRVIVFRYHDTIYACASQEIRRLTPGTTATWTTLTLPVAAFPAGVVDFRPICAIEFDDKGLVGGWDDNETRGGCILSITEALNGTITVAVEHVPEVIVGGGPVPCQHIIDFCILEGRLIYGYNSNPGQFTYYPQYWLGVYNGVTFQDDQALFVSTESSPGGLWRLYSTGAIVYAGARSTIDATALDCEAGLFSVQPITQGGDPVDGIYISRLNNTTTLLTDSSGASDIIAI